MDEKVTAKGIPQPDVFDLIRAERAYQDAKWGKLAEHSHPLGEWLLVIEGKLREAVTLWQQGKGDGATLSKVAYIAATAVACLESVGGPLIDEWMEGMELQRANSGYLSPNQRAKRWYPVLEEIIARRNAEAVKAAEATAEAKRIADTLAEVSTSMQEV